MNGRHETDQDVQQSIMVGEAMARISTSKAIRSIATTCRILFG